MNRGRDGAIVDLLLPLSLVLFCVSFSASAYDVPKPSLEKPNLGGDGSIGHLPKLNTPLPNSYGYEPKSKPEIPNVQGQEVYKKIGVQGIVLCQLGSKVTPLEGAVARLACLATDENGNELAPFYILSGKTDKKGYFFKSFDLSKLLQPKSKLLHCKAFLDSSPSNTCYFPTDINKGLSGCKLEAFHLLPHNKMTLYSLKPFVFTSE